MGKLFWKFFFGFWACLLIAAAGTGGVLYALKEPDAPADLADGPRAQFMLEAMQAVLQGQGPEALNDLLARNTQRTGLPVPVYAVSESGQDILGRAIPDNIQEQIKRSPSASPNSPASLSKGLLIVRAQDGSYWTLFIPKPRQHGAAAPQKPAHRNPPAPWFGTPFLGLGVALLASVLFAGGLAHWFSKPLDTLKDAFREAGRGKSGIRIGTTGATGEIAELLQGFDHMAQEIETRIQQQQALLHDVSHELRSPLARLNLAVGLARQNPTQLESSLGRIESEAERLDLLIGELLNLSRLEVQQDESSLQTHNVIELLSAVADDAAFEAEQLGKGVQFSGEVSVWNFKCEPEVLQRAFDNIIRNAVRHTPTGTRVEVACAVGTKGDLNITIADHGPGVPSDLLDKLFDPFFKHGVHAGHGLGLAIAKRAVERHGGQIVAVNRQPRGMQITVQLKPVRPSRV